MKIRNLLLGAAMSIVATLSMAGPQDDLWKAILQCDLDGVKKSVEAGADVKAMHPSNQNSLALAYLCPEVTAYLIEQGVDPNSDGGGALVGACNNYSTEVVKMLLDAGADPNAKSPIYATNPVEITLRQTNCVPCLKMLAEKGADLKRIDENGANYVHTLAVFTMTADQRKDLFAKGKATMESYGLKVPDWYANLGPDRNGTPEQMLDILVDAGCDINLQNGKGGYTPLMVAIGIVPGAPAKHFLAKALLERGADVTIQTDTDVTAISLASSMDDSELLKMIIDKGADVNSEYWYLDPKVGTYLKGFTPLALAAKFGHIGNCKILFEAGAKPREGARGYAYDPVSECSYQVINKTPIYYAIESGKVELVKVFTDNFKFWNNNMMVIKVPDRSSEEDYGTFTIKTTYCRASKGPVRPGMYAKKLGYKDIQGFLATKGL